VTGRPRTGRPAGAQSGGSAQPRLVPVPPPPPPDCGAEDESGSITPTAAAREDERAAPAATTVSSAASGQPSAVPLVGDLPTERRRLPPRVTRYWRWRAFYSSLPVLVLLVSAAIVLPWGPWWVRWGIVGVFVVVIAAGVIILTPIRYRVFWYAISPTDIDIQKGIIFTTRSIIPMHRVQSLQSERGPVADHYRMATLKIRTAAGSVSLSGLDRGEADELSERIGRLAVLADDV
jgi:membrane protein YdbS with pleckstrin-like domain